MHDVPVGIDDLNLYASTLSIDNADIGRARGTSRYFDIVGIKRRSIAPPFEDAVTLAVNAARPLVEAAGPDAFELLIVATESGFDFGKPLSSYVHRHLGLGRRCRNLEVKHACYGGTASLQLAAGWLRSGVARGKRALVVTTDLPGNQFGEPAEMTPGTGAVALSLAEEPRVLELDRAAGYAALEVYDTARPTATGHWVDEVLSLGAYLDLLEDAYAHYRAQVPGDASSGTSTTSSTTCRWRRSCARRTACCSRPTIPTRPPTRPRRASSGWWRRPSRTAARPATSSRAPSTPASRRSSTRRPVRAPAPAIALYSYGSGSCAEFFSGTLRPEARAVVGAHGIRAHLEARRALTIPDYERIVREREAIAGVADWAPDRELPAGPLRGVVRRARSAGARFRQGLLPALRMELNEPAADTRIVLPRAPVVGRDRPAPRPGPRGAAGHADVRGHRPASSARAARSTPPRTADPRPELFAALLRAIEAAPVVVLAVVDGPALGAGAGIAAAADVVIATPRARFGLPETVMGLVPAMVFPVLARRLGVARARRLALGAAPLTAEEALAQGLADEVDPDAGAAAARVRRRLARQDPDAVAALKQLIARHFATSAAYEAAAADALRARWASAETRKRLQRYADGGAPWDQE